MPANRSARKVNLQYQDNSLIQVDGG